MKHVVRVSATILMLLSSTATVTHAQTAGPAGLTNGLVTWLQLDEQAGNRAQDASGSGRSALIENGTAAPVAGRTSGSGGILLSGTKNLRIPLAWQPARFTISWWVAPNSRGVWTQAVKAGWWGGFLFHTSPDGTIYVGTDQSNRIRTAAGVFELNSSPTQPRWQLYTFTFDKAATLGATTGTGRLYKNGVEIGSSTTMRLPDAWTELTIGSTDSQFAADGYYDDVRVYDRALSATEVAQLATSTAAVYTPPTSPADDLDRNWSASRSYDGNGNVIGESKSFTDALGRSTQAQVKSQTTGHVLATQTVYSSGGKPVLSTLAAPTNNSSFSYKTNFLTASGQDYRASNFEDANANSPTPIDQPSSPGSVGYYYSANNTLEPLTATTQYPFSLKEEYGGPLGGVKRAAGPGESFRMGSGRETKGREFPLLNDLDHYLALRPQFVLGSSSVTTLRLKGEKAVSMNADGKESISFSDADGKLLATCLSGSQYPGVTLSAAIHSVPTNSDNLPQYQDIHVPAAGPVKLSVQGSGRLRIINLVTEAVSSYVAPWQPVITLQPGFYRVISEQDNQIVSYLARYGEFSYSYYDDAGRVVATVAPRGLTQGLLQENLVKNPGFESDGATQNPQFWQTDQNWGMAYTETYGGAHSGSLHGTHYSGSSYYAFTHQIITGLPNGRYTLRAWVKGSGGQAKAYLLARNFGGNLAYTSFPTTIGGALGEWSQLELRDLNVTNGQCDIGFESQANAGQFIYYDDVEFFRQPDTATPQFVTRNTYSGAGTLLATESTDEGRTEYAYARDGRIRFSQSALQKQQSRFSYSNYDEVGRVVESGEYQMASGQGHVFENQLPRVVAYEAENAQSNPGPNTNWSGYRGTGFVGDLTAQGTYVQFNVNVPRKGRYPVVVRYSAGRYNSLRTMPLYVNWNYKFHANFPATNAWDTWALQVIDMDLEQGSNLIRFQHDGRDNEGWINVDYLEVTEEKTPASNSVLNLLEERMPTNSLDIARCSQRNQVWYDLPTQDSQLNGRSQEFVLGAVAKTSNGTNTTWYSYDELGRVTWMVQQVPGVGVKTVDYTYDFTGNVLEVAYQKGQADAFYHHYEYDADRRLRSVYTSPDGMATNRTLHARYFYYLHGPLKRVEIADRLQGVDYAYTVQGWLKSINNSQKSLDPGQDSPTANGMLKDLFGMRLDYFDGDYASRQLTAPSVYAQPNQNEIRYDGTVRTASWQTAAAATVHANAYRYDAKGQLLESIYGQLYSGNYFSYSSNRPYEEGNLSYDTHGNILSLRRRDGAGFATDDFTYQYTANTNKLQAVKNQVGATVLSYDYDVNGQMTRESEMGKGDKYLRYDVTGKVTGVYRNADFTGPVATYTYDDRGFRSSKVTYTTAGAAQNTTTYVTDAQGNVLSTYEQPAGQGIQQTEVPLYGSGRVGTLTRLDDGTLDARYELNDQLGNARVIFHKPKTTKLQAFMELGQATEEEKTFANVASTRTYSPYAYGGNYVSRINPSQGITQGPALDKPLAVEKGDTLTFSAYTLALPAARPAAAKITPLLITGAAVSTAATLPSVDPEGRSSHRGSWLRQLAAGVAFTGFTKATQQRVASTTGGSTSLRYILKDTDGNVVEDRTVSSTTATGAWQQLRTGVRAANAGTVEVMLTSTMPQEVLFDNVEVEQTGNAIVQEQHQYAFGSPLTGLNYVVGNKRYRHGYQGQYAEGDLETGYESFKLRLYNSRIGRWMSFDPKGQFNSPYVGMGNNPVSSTDPDGGFSGDPVKKATYSLGNITKKVYQLPEVRVVANAKRSVDIIGNIGRTGGAGLGSVGLSLGRTAATHGRNYGTAAKNFAQWASGSGPDTKIYMNDRVANAMKDSYGVNKSRDYFYKMVNEGRDVIDNPVTGLKGPFGVADLGPLRSGIDPIEQYVGTYRVQSIQVVDKNLVYTITNETSMNSFLYDLGPSWERSSFSPGGTTRQAYIFSEPIDFNRITNTSVLKP